MKYNYKPKGTKFLRLLTLLFMLAAISSQPKWLSAQSPCELPCCCPEYANCIAPEPGECPEEPCEDKYGNPVACPPGGGGGGGGGGGETCHDKYGNIVACPGGGDGGCPTGVCCMDAPDFNPFAAAAAGCSAPRPPDCPGDPSVTWSLCQIRDITEWHGATATLTFSGAANWYVKEKVTEGYNSCTSSGPPIGQQSIPYKNITGILEDGIYDYISPAPDSCSHTTHQTIFWGPSLPEQEKCKYSSIQLLIIEPSGIKIKTFGSNETCTNSN